jgi:uncharacterized protein YhjY with autotransporter beta-barrel domain
MKQLSHTRRQIFRAIHAACVALFLAAFASHAQAQIDTTPFVITGSTVTTAPPGTYSGAFGFWDNVNTYNSITVSSGISITNTASIGAVTPVNGVFAVIGATTSSFSNAGTLAMSNSGYATQAVVNLSQAGTPLTFTNTGTMTTTAGANIGFGIFASSTSGSLNITNEGLVSSTGAAGSGGVVLTSSAAPISFTNSGTVTLTAPTGTIVSETTTGANLSFSNSGYLNSAADGVVLGTSGGATVSNTGTIVISNGGDVGIKVSTTGNVTANNSGLIQGSTGSNAGLYVATAGTVTETNSGTITGFHLGVVDFTSGSSSITNTGTITATNSGIYGSASSIAADTVLNNSGVINSGGTGINFFTPVTLTDSGNITSTGDSITVDTGSSVKLSGRPIINNTISGGATAASTSTLDFNLTISAANYAAAKAQLDADIQQYNTQGGGALLFTVDTLDYNILNFAANGITDDLVQARMYSSVPGFSGLGSALDNMPVNTASSQILTALDNVSTGGLPNALAELSPKSLEVFRNVAFDNNTFYTEQLNNHLANLRDGLTGFDSSAMSINTSNMDPALSGIKDHLLAYDPGLRPGLICDMTDPVLGGVDMKDMKDTKSMHVVTEPANRWSTFISGDVILASLDNNVPFQNSQYTTGNVTAGADYRLDDNFTVGALFSYAHSAIDLDYSGSKATVDSYAPGIYASYVNGGWYANGLATYVRNSYTEDREIDIPGIGGDNHGATDGNQGTGNLTGGYEFQHGSFKFGPVATVEYVHLDINSISEQGPTALNIANQSDDSLRTLVGFEGRFATTVDTCCGKWILTPHFSASWQHESLDNSNGITAQFSPAGGGSFATPLDQPERDSAFIDTGLDAQLNKAATVFVDYQVQAGQDDFFAQSVQGGIKVSF